MLDGYENSQVFCRKFFGVDFKYHPKEYKFKPYQALEFEHIAPGEIINMVESEITAIQEISDPWGKSRIVPRKKNMVFLDKYNVPSPLVSNVWTHVSDDEYRDIADYLGCDPFDEAIKNAENGEFLMVYPDKKIQYTLSPTDVPSILLINDQGGMGILYMNTCFPLTRDFDTDEVEICGEYRSRSGATITYSCSFPKNWGTVGTGTVRLLGNGFHDHKIHNDGDYQVVDPSDNAINIVSWQLNQNDPETNYRFTIVLDFKKSSVVSIDFRPEKDSFLSDISVSVLKAAIMGWDIPENILDGSEFKEHDIYLGTYFQVEDYTEDLGWRKCIQYLPEDCEYYLSPSYLRFIFREFHPENNSLFENNLSARNVISFPTKKGEAIIMFKWNYAVELRRTPLGGAYKVPVFFISGNKDIGDDCYQRFMFDVGDETLVVDISVHYNMDAMWQLFSRAECNILGCTPTSKMPLWTVPLKNYRWGHSIKGSEAKDA